MQRKFNERGFTLIELLIVIAIIGVLASIVMASLGSARSKGTDASRKSSLTNMRAQAELVYIDLGSYATVCDNPQVQTAVTTSGGSCSDAPNSWVFAADLLNGNSSYCVDSTGFAGVFPGVTAAVEVVDGVCDGS